jgi:hypothetical protein
MNTTEHYNAGHTYDCHTQQWTTTTTEVKQVRTSAEIMAEMRSCAGPNSWNVSVDLEREYMAAKQAEKVAMDEYMSKLDGGRGWFRKLVSK